MKKLSQKRKNELRKNYSNGDSVGRALIRYFIEGKKVRKNPDYKMTLGIEELNFIKTNLENEEDKKIFKRYVLVHKILTHYDHWTEYYQQIFYHGLFRALAAIQPVGSELEKLNLLCSFLPKNSEESQNLIENSREKLSSDLDIINEILISNWENLILFAIKNLHYYVFSLENIKNRTKLDIDETIPDIPHHEFEIKELQRIANELKKNLEYYQKTTLIELENTVIKTIQTLSDFCQIDISITRTTEEENRIMEEELLGNIHFSEDFTG